MHVCTQVTYNLKPQIAALASTHNPGTANPTADPIANSTANPTVNPIAAESKGLRVEGPCRDVRIMAWLVNPDRAGVGDDDSKHLPKVRCLPSSLNLSHPRFLSLSPSLADQACLYFFVSR